MNPADAKDRRWLFPAPGEYMVRITVLFLTAPATPGVAEADPMSGELLRVQAEPAVARVVAPADSADVAAATALLALPSQWILYEPTCAGAVIDEDLLGFRKKHAGSRYIPFTELAIIYPEFLYAVVGKDKAAAGRACDRARKVAEQAHTFAWPQGWRTKADRLVQDMFEQYRTHLP